MEIKNQTIPGIHSSCSHTAQTTTPRTEEQHHTEGTSQPSTNPKVQPHIDRGSPITTLHDCRIIRNSFLLPGLLAIKILS